MIDKQLFLAEMEILEERFGRKLSDPVFDRYYQSLSEKLDNAQFKAACRRVFEEEEFFPSPQRFCEKVRVATEDLALLEWDRVFKASSNPENGFEGLTETGKKALVAIGGLRRVGHADIEFQVPAIRKEFMSYYRAYAIRADEALPELASGLNGGSYLPVSSLVVCGDEQ